MQTSSLVPPIRPGVRAHIKSVFPFPLPKGLVEGALVTVERIEDGSCAVRDRQGKTWTVPTFALDPGQLVWREGHWVPETAVTRA